MTHKFENLRVWKESVEFTKMIYKFCNQLPKNEERNLSDQLRRASTSIVLNIAEGSESPSDVDFKRFLSISKKSQIECIAALKLLHELYSVPIEPQVQKAEDIGKMLYGLVQSLILCSSTRN